LKHTVGKLASRYFAPRSVALHRLPSAPQLDRPGYKPDPREWARQTRAIAAQWRKLGLPERTYLYGIDEPREDQYAFVRDAYEQIHELVPDLPIMQTVNHQVPDPLRELVDIWCPLSSRLESDFYRERLQAGDTLWVYVCCSPTHPYGNFFIDRPATEHRLLFWQTWQAQASGFLYWCSCWWKGLPTPGSAQPAWPEVPIRMRDHAASGPRRINGDGLLIYPGPQLAPYPSIRLEVIRDGIEDYEYLALLKRLRQETRTRGSPDPSTAELLDRAAALCAVPESIARSMTEYTRDPADIYARRAEIGDMIEQLAARDAGRE
jgi:hypothetical protein